MTETYKEKLISKLPPHLQHTAKRGVDNLFLADVVEELNRLTFIITEWCEGWWYCSACERVFAADEPPAFEGADDSADLCYDCAQIRGMV